MYVQKGNIFEILNGNKQFLIPVYQRYYSWERKHCERLYNDIVDMQKKEKKGHFIGSIVNIAMQAMPTGVQKYMIIDGQQRMTTLTLLLVALRDYYKLYPSENSINHDRIDWMLLKNQFEMGDERYKLILTENDKKVLIDLIDGKILDEDLHSKILSNYKFFFNKIKERKILPSEIYESIGKLQIVNITLDRENDDAQEIFESLNSTGKDLSESDLIRNYILMGLYPKEQIYIYENYWRVMEQLFIYENQEVEMDAFFRHYLIMKMATIPKQGLVYEEFKSFYINSGFENIEELCKDLIEYAKYYTDIIFKKKRDEKLSKLYEDIVELRMEVSYPFLLKLHHDKSEGVISYENLLEILKYCISYVLRRSICDIPTNSLNKTFAIIKNSIQENDYINSIKAFFISQESYKEFPDDYRFSAAFISRDIYNMRIGKYILSRLENYDNKAPINIKNYTVEHIIPQNKNLSKDWQNELGSEYKEIQKKYIHSIGNLTLTAYNSEMSDRSFMEKMNIKGGFKESALRLNSYVIKQSNWNEYHIQKRADELCEKAIKIWSYPSLEKEELLKYKNEKNPIQKYSLESYSLNEHTRSLFDALNKSIMALSQEVNREYKKKYIAYKVDTNFVDIQILSNKLYIVANIKFKDVHDPKGICEDVSDVGKFGNGDVRMSLNDISEIDQVMEIIKQSYKSQIDKRNRASK